MPLRRFCQLETCAYVAQLLHAKSATVIEVVDRLATHPQHDVSGGVSGSMHGDRRQGEAESRDCQHETSAGAGGSGDRRQECLASGVNGGSAVASGVNGGSAVASGVNGGSAMREHTMLLREMVMQSCGMRVVLVNKRAFRAASSAERRQWLLDSVILVPNGVLDVSLRGLSAIDDDGSFMAHVRALSQVPFINRV